MTYGVVDVSLCTHEDGLWITQKDIDMAQKISQIARQQGLEPEPTAVAQLEIALDTANETGVAPFWSVLLTGSPGNKIYDSVFDPTNRVPALWFQGTSEHKTARQRWHFDLWLAPEVAQERIMAPSPKAGPSSTIRRRRHSPCRTGRQQRLRLHLPRAKLMASGKVRHRRDDQPHYARTTCPVRLSW